MEKATNKHLSPWMNAVNFYYFPIAFLPYKHEPVGDSGLPEAPALLWGCDEKIIKPQML